MSTPAESRYRKMERSLVWRVLAVSVLPLLVIATANFLLFFALNRRVVSEQQAALLAYHRESIEAFLDSLTAEVTTLADQYTLSELANGDLERIFQVLQQRSGVFTDIGIIDASGAHVTYVGPYDLASRNYRGTDWFARVVADGVYVSDMFLGYRAVPHFVIAVRRDSGDTFWILRATVNTDHFSRLVNAARAGVSGEAFILDERGVYQTPTRFGGAILSPSRFPDLAPHDGVRVRTLEIGGTRYLCTTTWLGRPRWLLVFRQRLDDAFVPLRRAVVVGIVMSAAGVLGAAALAVLVARSQVRRIRRADREKEALTERLVATGRTAAVGEMSAGLAHEINNPLATIDALGTWIGDLAASAPIAEQDRAEIVDSAAKIGEQVERCKAITQGLLKFARRVESRPEEVDVNTLLAEMATVMRARARVDAVTFDTELEPVPMVLASPTHVQQIFMNLVNNAIDAVIGRADGAVRVRSRRVGAMVRVEITDNGCGIPREHLSRIFTPFFTTKPVGRGTGLGLAICYGLVQELGGSIEVASEEGRGSTFTVDLPVAPAAVAAGARA